MCNNLVEYFENELHSQPEVDNCNMFHREIVVHVGQSHTVDFIRKQLWKLCQGLELKLGLEYSFNDVTKIFAIIKRYKERIYCIRVYICIADKIGLQGLHPDVIVVYGNLLAEQVGMTLKFIQQNSYKASLELKFFNR